MPAIVISDHGDGAIAEFGFAGEFGFGDVGHADDVEIHGAVHVGFGEGGELRAFHTDVGALAVDFNAAMKASVGENAGNLRAGGLVKCDVSDEAAPEKCGDAIFGAIDELVCDEKLNGSEVLFQGSRRADGNYEVH